MKIKNIYEPENLLKDLNIKLRKFYSLSMGFIDNDTNNKLRSLTRTFSALELIYNKGIIAITGLQGVGKTALIRSLYDLENGYLPEVYGIGEKIPVLISEYEGNEIKCVCKKIINKNGVVVVEDEIISKEEFNEFSSSPRQEHVLLELIVPFKNLHTKNQSFMLLPGIDQDDDCWNELAKRALKASSTCIILLNETKMADFENKKFIEDLNNTFSINKPIIALTSTDRSNDGNLELKNTVIEKFKIDQERIILTSTEKEHIKIWSKEFIDTIKKYDFVEGNFRTTQLKMLDETLRELNDIINKVIMDKKINNTREFLINNSTYKDVLDVINNEKIKICKLYRKELSSIFDIFESKARNIITDSIIEKNILEKALKKIKSTSLKDVSEARKEICDCWNKAWANDYENINQEVISNIIANNYQRYDNLRLFYKESEYEEIAITSEYESLNNDNSSITEMFDSNYTPLFMSNNSVEDDIDILKDIQKFFDKNNLNETSKSLINSLRYIPVMLLDMIGVRDYIINLQYNDNLYEGKLDNSKFKYFIDTMKSSTEKSKNIMNVLGLIFGVDAVDGTVDVIPEILSMFGIKVAKMTSSIGIGIFGVISLGMFSLNFLSQLNRIDIENEMASHKAIGLIRDNIYNSYVENFEKSMDSLIEYVEEKIREIYGIDSSISDNIDFDIRTAQLKDVIREVGIRVNEYSVI